MFCIGDHRGRAGIGGLPVVRIRSPTAAGNRQSESLAAELQAAKNAVTELARDVRCRIAGSQKRELRSHCYESQLRRHGYGVTVTELATMALRLPN
jgi:hypothetical protein